MASYNLNSRIGSSDKPSENLVWTTSSVRDDIITDNVTHYSTSTTAPPEQQATPTLQLWSQIVSNLELNTRGNHGERRGVWSKVGVADETFDVFLMYTAVYLIQVLLRNKSLTRNVCTIVNLFAFSRFSHFCN